MTQGDCPFWVIESHCGQAVAVDLAVDVKGVDIGHTAYVVKDGKQFVVYIGGLDVILARYAVYKKLGVLTLRIEHSLYHKVQEGAYDAETGQFHLQYVM